MKKCRFDPQIPCKNKDKCTKNVCLQCILYRKERHYATLLNCITTTIKVPMGNAGFIFSLLDDIYANEQEFRKWVKQYHPDKLLPKNQPQYSIETQMKRFSEEPKGLVV